MQKFDTPPDSREYVHDTCGKPTNVGGDDFMSLCDPRYRADRTFCCHCDKHDALKTFRWADTNEAITDYRTRLQALVPAWARIAGSSWLFVVWIVLAALTGYAISKLVPNFKIGYGIPAVVFFLVAAGFDAAGKFLTPEIVFRQYQ